MKQLFIRNVTISSILLQKLLKIKYTAEDYIRIVKKCCTEKINHVIFGKVFEY